MKILAVSTWFPLPPDNGARMRAYHLLKCLGQKHTVDLLAISQMESDAAHMDEARTFCRRAATFPPRKFVPKSMDAWRNFFSAVPRSFEGLYRPEMESLARRWMAAEGYDAVLAITLGAAPYAIKLDAQLRILDQHNVEYHILKRQCGMQPSILRRLRYAPTWIKAERFERFLASKFDLIAVVSEHERKLMREVLKSDCNRIEVVPNGFDPGLLEFQGPPKNERVLTFTGAMTYDANYDAARSLCREVLPLVQAKFPDVRLRVTGGYDGVDISEMAEIPGVEFTGYLEDIRPVVSSASALVVPLRNGGGTRLKILEAMALGTPVVSTPIGAEGIDVLDGTHIFLGKTPEDLAARTIELLSYPALASRIANSARNLVSERYRWPSIAGKFEEIVRGMGTQ